MIECNEISQTINYLLAQFDECKTVRAEDMKLLVELIAAVNTCANGGPDYNTTNTDVYEPITDEVVTYAPNSFHALSLVVVQGKIIYVEDIELPTGTSINKEFTTLNQQPFTFTAKAGSKVLIEYITETI